MADILLIHGSCHGAWCWCDLLEPLRMLGHRPRAIDLPSHGDDTTPIADVTLDSYARAITEAMNSKTVLLGHSMGGYAITAAAESAPDLVDRLIYLCAYVPAPDVTLSQMRMQAPRQPVLAAVRPAADGLSFSVDRQMAAGIFYQDCPQDAVRYALDRLCPQPLAPTQTPVSLTDASRRLPRRYIRCLQDGTIPPEFQITLTETWPDHHVHEMASGHSPFFSHPDELARIIDRAIRN